MVWKEPLTTGSPAAASDENKEPSNTPKMNRRINMGTNSLPASQHAAGRCLIDPGGGKLSVHSQAGTKPLKSPVADVDNFKQIECCRCGANG